VSGKGIFHHSDDQTAVEEDVALWVPTGEYHQMINTGDVPLKLATIFVPAYTAGENYQRCLDAAKAESSKQ
jgi:mannose-6-phosphate isomerase-like protein (cupin superfamily)